MTERPIQRHVIVEVIKSAGEIADRRLFHCFVFSAQQLSGVDSSYDFDLLGTERFVPVSGELSFDLWANEKAGNFAETLNGSLPFKTGPNFESTVSRMEQIQVLNPRVLEKLVELMNEGKLVSFTKYLALRKLLPEASDATIHSATKDQTGLTQEDVIEFDEIRISLQETVKTES